MDEEISFPRGSKTKGKKSVELSTKKAVKRKQDAVLFKDDAVSSDKKKGKLYQRREKNKSAKFESREDFEDEVPLILKTAGREVDNDAESATADVTTIIQLSQKTISEEMLLVGAIKEIHDYELVVSLPNLMTGFVQITDVSSTYTTLLENLQEVDLAEDEQRVPSLQSLYAVGSLVPCKVKSLQSALSGRKRIQLTLDPAAVHSNIGPNHLNPGMTLVGTVASIEDHGYIINVGIPQVRSFLSTSEAGKFIKDCNHGQPLFVGQPVTVTVKDVKANGCSLILTANPASIAKATAKQSSHESFGTLVPGTKVKTVIKSVCKTHLEVKVMSLYNGCVSYLHCGNNNTEAYKENQTVNGCILYNCFNRKALGLSLVPAHRHRTTHDALQAFHGLSVGDIAKTSSVMRIDEKLGILLELNKHARGFVHPSHISDRHEQNKYHKYSINDKATCRILDFNVMDLLAVVSLKKSVIDQPFIGYRDILPGSLVTGKLTDIIESGLRIQVSDHLNGFVPKLHMADVVIHKPTSRFTVGESLKLRVLLVNPERRRLLLTHKKTLVESQLPIISSYDQPQVNMLLHGCIVAIKEFGFLIKFYNDITGLIPRSELFIGHQPVTDDSYSVGQVVKCRVIKTFSPDAKRISLSLTLSSKEDRTVKEMDRPNPTMGEVTQVRVINVKVQGLDVIIQSDGTRAFLPKTHLSDFVANCGPLLNCYKKDDVIDDVMHWSYSALRRCPIVTRKPMLLEAKCRKELPEGFGDLHVGGLVMGVVKKPMPYGLFVELPNNVVGLVPNAAMSDDFIPNSDAFHIGQTLRGRITEVDSEKSRFLMSLKSSDCQPAAGEGRNLLEQYFKESDEMREILKANEEWKSLLELNIGSKVDAKIVKQEESGLVCELNSKLPAFIANGYIGDKDVEEGSKVSAYVLHGDLDTKLVDLCLDPKIVNLAKNAHKLPKKSQTLTDTEATVAMVREDFILTTLSSSGKLAYLPGRRHLNDIRVGEEYLQIGQTIQVTSPRIVNQRILTSQMIIKKKKPKEKIEKRVEVIEDKRPTQETTTPKKTASDIIQEHNLSLGQKVDVIVNSVHECQLNVRVHKSVLGRIHITETADELVPNKRPSDNFKQGMHLISKVIGHLEVKDHHYLPVTHTNFTKYAVDLTIKPSKVTDDQFKAEDGTLEIQLATYQPGQAVNCVVQKYLDEILWVSVTNVLQGKVYRLNLSKNVGVVEQPSKFFKAGSVKRATVINVDKERQVLELSLIAHQPVELTVGSVVNGRILKVLPAAGLVIQLPRGCSGRVLLTDLRDHYTEEPLKGFREKQFVRCCVMDAPGNDKFALSMRPSIVSKHHDPAIDVDIQSAGDVTVGDKVKGYVNNCTKVGVFVSLSRKVQGRIQFKKLSAFFVKEPESVFVKGKLITVKVLSIDEKTGKIELSSSSRDTGAEDPVPKDLREIRQKKAKKRQRKTSQGDEHDSGVEEEEPETLSDAEKSRDEKPLARLQVSTGLSWDEDQPADDGKGKKMSLLGNQGDSDSDDTSDDTSDGEQEQTVEEPPPKKSKREKQAAEKEEEDLLYKTEHDLMDSNKMPESSDEFDRLVLSSPDSSLVWIRYMAFYLQSAEIEKAKTVAERALKAINFREEKEKLNVWTAYLNLENLYGTQESLLKVFERALQHCEPYDVFQNLVGIYVRTSKLEQAEQLYDTMVKRFNFKKEVWISYGLFLMQNGRQDTAHKLMQRSFKSVMQKEHIDIISKFAQMEFKFGGSERGKTMFENVLSNYPKRTDIWSVYIDMMIKKGDAQLTRQLFERVIHLSLSVKKMKFLFKRYLDFEKKCGTEATIAEVKRKAVEYVESKMVPVDAEVD